MSMNKKQSILRKQFLISTFLMIPLAIVFIIVIYYLPHNTIESYLSLLLLPGYSLGIMLSPIFGGIHWINNLFVLISNIGIYYIITFLIIYFYKKKKDKT